MKDAPDTVLLCNISWTVTEPELLMLYEAGNEIRSCCFATGLVNCTHSTQMTWHCECLKLYYFKNSSNYSHQPSVLVSLITYSNIHEPTPK